MYDKYINELLRQNLKKEQLHRSEDEFEKRKRLIREGKV